MALGLKSLGTTVLQSCFLVFPRDTSDTSGYYLAYCDCVTISHTVIAVGIAYSLEKHKSASSYTSAVSNFEVDESGRHRR